MDSPHSFDLDSICYYFDAKDQDTYDRAYSSRRSEKLADLHRRLLIVSDREFDHCYKTLDKVLTTDPKAVKTSADKRYLSEAYSDKVKAKLGS